MALRLDKLDKLGLLKLDGYCTSDLLNLAGHYPHLTHLHLIRPTLCLGNPNDLVAAASAIIKPGRSIVIDFTQCQYRNREEAAVEIDFWESQQGVVCVR